MGRRPRVFEHEHGKLEKAMDDISVALRETCNVFKPIANRLDHAKGLFKSGARQDICDALDKAQSAYEHVAEACRRVDTLRKPLMDVLHEEIPSDVLKLIDHPDIEAVVRDDDYALTLARIAAREHNPMARLSLWRSVAEKLGTAISDCEKRKKALEYRISHAHRDTKNEGANAKSVLPKVLRTLEILNLRLAHVNELFYADRRLLLRDILAITNAYESISPGSPTKQTCDKSILRELDALYELAGRSRPDDAVGSSKASRTRVGQRPRQLS